MPMSSSKLPEGEYHEEGEEAHEEVADGEDVGGHRQTHLMMILIMIMIMIMMITVMIIRLTSVSRIIHSSRAKATP